MIDANYKRQTHQSLQRIKKVVLPKIVGSSNFFTFKRQILANPLFHEEPPLEKRDCTVVEKKIETDSSLDSIVIVSAEK